MLVETIKVVTDFPVNLMLLFQTVSFDHVLCVLNIYKKYEI
jgi:hypothetical protein